MIIKFVLNFKHSTINRKQRLWYIISYSLLNIILKIKIFIKKTKIVYKDQEKSGEGEKSG